MDKTNERVAMRVSRHSIIINVILAAFKLFAGIAAASAAMVSDAVHTLSDVLSTVVVMIGVKMADERPDKDHPYGHERFECVAAIILSILLGATGLEIGWIGVQKIIAGNAGRPAVPGLLALAAAVVSVAVKEAMYWYTRAAAQKTGSGAVMADAWHHRSDALSSVGSFAGILGARLGLPILDPAACLVICAFILKAAVRIFLDAVGKMTDRACDDDTVLLIRGIILKQESVIGIDQLKTRLFGDKIYVDVEVCADGGETLQKAHDMAQHIHDAIEAQCPRVKHCMVHVNPAGNDE